MDCRDLLFFVKLTLIDVEFSKFRIKFSKKSLFLAKEEHFVNTKLILGSLHYCSHYFNNKELRIVEYVCTILQPVTLHVFMVWYLL
jgi:hypothetical protein